MPSMRYPSSQVQRLIIEANADLTVRFTDDAEIRISTDDEMPQATPVEGGLEVKLSDSATLRLPAGVRLLLREANGSADLRGLADPVEIGEVNGSLYARDLSSVLAAEVNGQAVLRDIHGEVQISAVHGGLSLRDIDGAVNVGHVDGGLVGRNLPAGLNIEAVNGGLELRSSFNPETRSRVGSILGGAAIRVQDEGNVQFNLPNSPLLRIDPGSSIVREGERVIATFGEALASFEIGEAVAGLSISRRGDAFVGVRIDPDFEMGFSVDIENLTRHLDQQLSDVEERLSENLKGFEVRFGGSGDAAMRAQRRVERELEAARRHVAAAQRRAERAADRARDASEGRRVSIFVGGERGGNEPVTESERLAVLRMLEAGQISADQAQQLLKALEG